MNRFLLGGVALVALTGAAVAQQSYPTPNGVILNGAPILVPKADGSTGAGGQPIYVPPSSTNPVVTTPASGTIASVKIDQTTPGTTNGIQVNAALPTGTNTIGNTGSLTDRNTATPTITAQQYVSGNCIGGTGVSGHNFPTITFQGTGPINLIEDIRLYAKAGGTAVVTSTIWVYLFDQDPTASTCTDRSTFTLADADAAKTVMTPFSLTLVVPTGATQGFAGNPNLARIPKSGTTTLYYGLVAGSTFTPGSTSDIIFGVQVTQQHQ